MKLRSSNLGFTLIELLTTTAIIGVIAAIAIPNFSEYGKNVKLQNAAKDIASLIQMARTEAVQQNSFMNIETQSLESDDYGAELWLCTVSAPDDNCSSDTVVKIITIGSENLFIRSTGANNQADNNISFNAKGQLADAQLFLGICDERGTTAASSRYVQIRATGRPLIQKLDTSEGHKCNPD